MYMNWSYNFNSLQAATCCHLITLDPNQDQQNAGPNLDTRNRLTMKDFFEKIISSRRQQKREKLPRMNRYQVGLEA